MHIVRVDVWCRPGYDVKLPAIFSNPNKKDKGEVTMEKWYLLFFLLCPLMHLLMRGHNHGNQNCCGKKGISDHNKSDAGVKAP